MPRKITEEHPVSAFLPGLSEATEVPRIGEFRPDLAHQGAQCRESTGGDGGPVCTLAEDHGPVHVATWGGYVLAAWTRPEPEWAVNHYLDMCDPADPWVQEMVGREPDYVLDSDGLPINCDAPVRLDPELAERAAALESGPEMLANLRNPLVCIRPEGHEGQHVASDGKIVWGTRAQDETAPPRNPAEDLQFAERQEETRRQIREALAEGRPHPFAPQAEVDQEEMIRAFADMMGISDEALERFGDDPDGVR